MPTGDIVRAWTLELFGKKKVELAELLQGVRKIHISFDGWTAPNGRGLYGIVAFWCTTEGSVRRALLGIREVKGRHDGINIAACVRGVLLEYGIADQIGYYILDNASNNNTAVESLEATSRRSEVNGSTRLRCLGHIINLVVKHLYSTETEGKPSAVGKITDLITFINNSAFTKARWGLSDPNSTSLKSANDTRWGSTDMMVKSVLKDVNKFNAFIISIVNDPKNSEAIRSKCRGLLPSREDYAELEYLETLLKTFRTLQELCQGACDFLTSC